MTAEKTIYRIAEHRRILASQGSPSVPQKLIGVLATVEHTDGTSMAGQYDAQDWARIVRKAQADGAQIVDRPH